MNGTTTPPCVDRDGYLVVPAPKPGSWESGWGRVNADTGALFDNLIDNANPSAGFGNNDENLIPSCTQNLILSFHTEEQNANYTGAFELSTRKWFPIGKGWRNGQFSTNTQGGGGNPASISNGMIFHVSFHELVARTTN